MKIWPFFVLLQQWKPEIMRSDPHAAAASRFRDFVNISSKKALFYAESAKTTFRNGR